LDGCSGGTDSQDEVVSEAGAALIKPTPGDEQIIRISRKPSRAINRFPSLTNTEENPMTTVNPATKPAGIRLTRRSPAYWRVTIDNPPINVMGPEMVRQFQEVINALEADEDVRVVVFDSAVDDYFLNHSDFLAKLEDLTALPAGWMSVITL
jgi:hypothetical protein